MVESRNYIDLFKLNLKQLVATSEYAVAHKFRTVQQIKDELRNKTVNLKIVIRIKRVGATSRQALHKSHRLT